MADATYVLEVDWGNDGTFGHAQADITTDMRRASWSIGRDRASQLEGASLAGTLEVTLKNTTGKYNSFNSASPLTGLIKPKRKVRIRTTSPVAATLWTGYLASIEPKPRLGGVHEAVLWAEGPLSLFTSARARVAPQTSIATGTAVGKVLDAVGWPAGDRDIDAGQTTMTRWWADSSALFALREIEQTEGGFIREARNGQVVLEDRYRRLTSPHTTSQATYSDAGADIGYRDVRQEDPIQGIYNRIRARVVPYTVDVLAVLWTLSESTAPAVQPGDTVTYWAQYPVADSPPEAVGVDAWTTPVALTDYQANAAADGSGSDLTANLTVTVSKFATSMQIEIENTGSQAAYLTLLQARGTPVNAGDAITVSAEDQDSIDAYGEREFPLEARFIPDTAQAIDHCRFMVGVYAQEIPVLMVSYLANRDATSLADALSREVSDRVTVESDAATELGISEDFFIESMGHVLEPGGDHRVTLELSPASGFTGYWVLDVSRLDSETALAY